MGNYTSIHFTPVDRTWVAPSEFIRAVASMLEVTTFDHFTVYRELSPAPAFDEDDDDEDEHYEKLLSKYQIPIEDALPLQRADSKHWTHMMFPYGDFMKRLMAEIKSYPPESLLCEFFPWDTAIGNGHWAIYSYNEGTLTDGGAFRFSMSANGCPSKLALYLEQLLAVPGVKQFQQGLETLSNQPWMAVIDLT